ncbi:MAG: endolytic transglycosylase MltG [Patescibacteria group bacterium]
MRGDIIPPKRFDDGRPSSRQSTGLRPAASGPVVAPQSQQPSVASQPVRVAHAEPAPVNPAELPSLDTHDKAVPGRRFSKKHLYGLLGGVVIIVVVFLLGLFGWYVLQLEAVSPESTEKVKITIEPGTGPSGIAALLKQNDLIKSEAAFSWYVRQQGKSGLLQSGMYRLSKSEDVPTIVKHLTSGNTDTFSITFLPGATLEKHRQVLIDAGYEAQQVDAALAKTYDHPIFEGKPASADLEGYVYGETYNFAAQATPEEILTRTFDQFQTIVAQNDLVELYKKQGFSLFQGITMASIIQREVATPEDAAQVAQVFKTRYDMNMQLGSDVTYQYIADKIGQPRSVDFDSPYNTRRYTGLPPGPISSPGLASLTAVGSPAPGDFIYFLSGDDDKTYFARTNEEHERNIRDHCQKKCQII